MRERPLVRQILWKRYIVNKTDLQTFLERQFPDMRNFDINVWNLPSGDCPPKVLSQSLLSSFNKVKNVKELTNAQTRNGRWMFMVPEKISVDDVK